MCNATKTQLWLTLLRKGLNRPSGRFKFRSLAFALVPIFGLLSPVAVQASGLSVVVNEVDCHGNDWVELFNRSSESVDISDWILTDKKFSTKNLAHLYKFPAGTVLVGKSRLVVQQTGVGNLKLPFGISCIKGGIVRLGQPLSLTSTTLMDEFAVPGLAAQVTYGRVSDGSSNKELTVPTKNAANKTALPIPVGSQNKVCLTKKLCVITLRAKQTTKFQLVKKQPGVTISTKGKLTISPSQIKAKIYQVKLSNAVGSRVINFRILTK